jgi:hypothetical protein
MHTRSAAATRGRRRTFRRTSPTSFGPAIPQRSRPRSGSAFAAWTFSRVLRGALRDPCDQGELLELGRGERVDCAPNDPRPPRRLADPRPGKHKQCDLRPAHVRREEEDRGSCGCYPGVTPELEKWSGRLDSNQRPPAPKAGALPGCATPRHRIDLILLRFQRSVGPCPKTVAEPLICPGIRVIRGFRNPVHSGPAPIDVWLVTPRGPTFDLIASARNSKRRCRHAGVRRDHRPRTSAKAASDQTLDGFPSRAAT